MGTSDAVGDGVVLGEASVRLHAKGGHDALPSDGSLSSQLPSGPARSWRWPPDRVPKWSQAGDRWSASALCRLVTICGQRFRGRPRQALPIYAWAGERLLVQQFRWTGPAMWSSSMVRTLSESSPTRRDCHRCFSGYAHVLTWSATAGGGELGVIDLASGRKDAVMSAEDWATVASTAWHGQTVFAAVRTHVRS